MQRRLAAILATDVVGYSRLMGADEVGTLTSLKSHRRELINSAISEYRGRIVKTTGDGMLLEFASVVDAVAFAVTVQRAMLRRNASIPDDKRIVFRIGINVGDVIIDGDDIFGDGVNIAARLEALCEPGGVCISRAANEQVRDKLSLCFADLGEQTVKNIARAVGVYGLAAKDIMSLPDGATLGTPEPARKIAADEQEMHFCQTRDGVQLAHAKTGQGPPIVKTGNWMTHLMRVGWGQENPAFRQMFTSQFIPGATKEQADWFNELQRISASPEDAVRNSMANGETDVTALLGKVSVPTLVMHSRHDARVPFESGRRLAAGIPGARFVPLESRNHLILEDEPAFPRFLEEIKSFLEPKIAAR